MLVAPTNMKISMLAGLVLQRTRWGVVLLLLAFGIAVPSVRAGERYLEPGQVDGVALLASPPAADSPEQAADFACVWAVFKTCTPEERSRAERSASLSIYNFTPVIGEFFQKGRFPKLDALMEAVKTNSTESIDAPKAHWNRLRPYQLDPELVVGRPERNASYPSGHSTRGTIQSLVLAELFPERRDAILEFGRQIGWDRVRIGKHFPTDVYAGRVLGQAVVREMLKSPAFQRDLAAARSEVKAAVAATPSPAASGR